MTTFGIVVFCVLAWIILMAPIFGIWLIAQYVKSVHRLVELVKEDQ